MNRAADANDIHRSPADRPTGSSGTTGTTGAAGAAGSQGGTAKGSATGMAEKASETVDRVAADLGAQARATADRAMDAAGQMAGQMGATTQQAFNDLSVAARETATQTMNQLSDHVQRNPLKSIAIAAGIGLVLGLLSRSEGR